MLEVQLTPGDFGSVVDNVAGTIDFSAATVAEALTGDFVLAVVTAEAQVPSTAERVTTVAFNQVPFRPTEAFFTASPAGGGSVLDDLITPEIKIFKPLVDLRLGLRASDDQFFEDIGQFDGFEFARGQEFEVLVRVEPNEEQKVDAVDVRLRFDPSRLAVVGPIVTSGNLEFFPVADFDNDNGTVDISALTIFEPVADTFIMAAIPFRAKRASRGLALGFLEDDNTHSRADREGASVLRDIIDYPAEIDLQLRLTSFAEADLVGQVLVSVRPNGNEISAVDVFLDAVRNSSGDLTLNSITPFPGSPLQPIRSRVDNVTGTADYSTATVGDPPIGEYRLARLSISVPADVLAGNQTPSIVFHTDPTRKTIAYFEGIPILDERLLLTSAEIRAEPPGPLSNMVKFPAPKLDNTPTFDWDPPLRRPAAGIANFRLVIKSGDSVVVDGDFVGPGSPGTLQCFDLDGDLLGAGAACLDIDTFDSIASYRFTLSDDNALQETGLYDLSVTPSDHLGQAGETTDLPESFIVDITPPTVPVSSGALSVPGAFTNDTTPVVEWETSLPVDRFNATGDLKYDVEIGRTRRVGPDGRFREPAKDILSLDGLTWTVPELGPNTYYWWHVRSLDDAGEIQEFTSFAEAVADDRGNLSGFGPPVNFLLDTNPPTVPGSLRVDQDVTSGRSIDGVFHTPDTTPTFLWSRSTDPNFDPAAPGIATGSGVDLYNIAITGRQPTTADDSDAVCPADVCSFTVSGDLASSPTGVAYAASVESQDGATNTSAAAITQFNVDTAAPGAPALVFPQDDAFLNNLPPIFNARPRFDWDASAGEPYDYRLQVVVSGDSFTAGNFVLDRTVLHPTTEFRPGANLNDGAYNWRVIARDRALNLAPSETRTFTVDTVAPDPAAALESPPDGAFTGDTTLLLVWTASPSPFSDLDVHEYVVRVTAGGQEVDSFVVSGDATQFQIPDGQPLVAGDPAVGYQWTVIARDRAGNTPKVNPSGGFTLDTIDPDSPERLVRPPDGAFINNRTPAFIWDPAKGLRSTADDLNVFEYELQATTGGSIDTGAPAFGRPVVSGDTTRFPVPAGRALADGPYQWRVVSQDRAGNRPDVVPTNGFTLDATPPDAPASWVRATTGELVEDLREEITWLQAQDRKPAPPGVGDGSGIDFYEIRVIGPQLVVDTVSSGDCSIVCRYTTRELVVGRYIVEVRSVDKAGNRSDTAPPDDPDLADGFFVGTPDRVQNLTLVGKAFEDPVLGSAVNDSNTRFGWNPPFEPPEGSGLLTGDGGDLLGYEIAITGDASLATPFNIPFTLFTGGAFFVLCHNADGGETGTGPQECAPDNFVEKTDVIEITVTGDGVPDGTHTLHIRAVWRGLGNQRAVKLSFTVDTVAPEPSAGLVSPEDLVFTNVSPALFDWDASPTPIDPGDLFATQLELFEYVLQVISGDNFQSVGSGDVFEDQDFGFNVVVSGDETEFRPTEDLVDAKYRWRVVARDRTGNPDTGDEFRTFDLDTEAPLPSAELVFPSDGSFTNDNAPLFDWDPSPSKTGDRDVFEYILRVSLAGQLETGPFLVDDLVLPATGDTRVTGDSLTQFLVLQPLDDGVYDWRVTARDRSGNTAAIDATFTVDTVVPAASAGIIRPADGDFTNDNTPLFQWDPATGDNSSFDDLNVFEYVVVATGDTGDTPLNVAVSGDTTQFQAVQALSDAFYSVRVIARDRAGNEATTDVNRFTLDTVVPAPPAGLVFPASGDFVNVGTALFDWDGAVGAGSSFDNLNVFEYVVQVSTGGLTGDTFDLEAVVSGDTTQFQDVIDLSDAVYGWRVLSRDRAGNTATTADNRFTLDTQAPIIANLTKTVENLDDTLTFEFDTIDNLSRTVLHRLHIEGTSDKFIDFSAPDQPVLVEPAVGLFSGDLARLAWRASDNISQANQMTYIVDIDTVTGDFLGQPVVSLIVPPALLTGDSGVNGELVTFALTSRLATADMYAWRVKAIDRAGNIGDYSQSGTFSLGQDNAPPLQPVLQTPADGALVQTDTSVSFGWAAPADQPGPNLSGVVSYDLEIAFGTADFSNLPFTADEIQDTAFTLDVSEQLPEGVYQWHIRAVDQAGNTGDFSIAFTFVVTGDGTGPPAPPLVSPADGVTVFTANPTFQWGPPVPPDRGNPAKGLQSFTLQIGDENGDFTGATEFDAQLQFELELPVSLPDGSYTWRVFATDIPGNVGDPSESRAFTVALDVEGPQAPVAVSPGSGDRVGPITTFSWRRSSDLPAGLHSGIASFRLEVLASGDQVFTDPDTGEFLVLAATEDAPDLPIKGDLVQFTLSSGDKLASGDYFWHVRGEDNLGFTGDFSPLIGPFTVDTGDTGDGLFAPPIPALLAPADGLASGDTTPLFRWTTVVDDFGTGRGPTTYILEIGTSDAVRVPTGDLTDAAFRRVGIIGSGDFAEFALTTGDSLFSGDSITTGGLPDGVYHWHVAAVDGAGNTGDFSAIFSFTVDTQTPPAPVPLLPADGDTTDNKTPTFAWGEVTGDLSGVTFTLEITSGDSSDTGDVGQFLAARFIARGIAESQFTLTGSDALDTGDYIWHVRTDDNAGNRSGFSTPFSLTIVQDITPPETPVLQLPSSGDTVGTVTADSARPQFQWIFTGDTGDVSFGLKVTGDAGNLVLEQAGLQTTDFIPAQQLAGGFHTWRVVASDAAGNTADSEVGTFNVVGAPGGLTVDRVGLLQVLSSATQYTPVFQWSAVPGADRYEASVDHAGFSVIAPVASGDTLTLVGELLAYGEHHLFQVRAVQDGSEFRGAIAGLFFNDQVRTGGTPTAGDPLRTSTIFTVADDDFLPLGTHVLQVSGEDRALNAGQFDDGQTTFAVSQLIISLQPAAQSVQTNATASLNVQIEPRGLRIDGAEVSIDIIGLQLTGIINVAPGVVLTADAGTSTADLTASFDAARTETFTLVTIQVSSASPVSPTTPNVELVNDGGRRTVGLLAGEVVPAVLAGAIVTVTSPPPPPGGGGGGAAPPANEPPVANAGSNQTVNEGASVTLNGVLSFDPEAAPITYSWSQPAGVVLSSTAADRPSFVAPDGPADLTFTLTVTDEGGESASDSVTITVVNVPPNISNVTVSPRPVAEGGSGTITVTATDPAGVNDPLTYSFDCDDNASFEIGPQPGNSASCTFTEGPSQTVNVRVEDDDQGVAEDDIAVPVSNVAPNVDAGDDATINEGETFVSSGAFSDPGADSWTATVDYGDGSGTESLGLSGRAFTLRHDYVDNGVFDVVVVVDDGDDTGRDTVTATVTNVPPDVADIADGSADEGETFNVDGSFLDPGLEDAWTATVNYGDGSGVQTLALNLDNYFSLNHVFEDDGNFSVNVSVTDDDGGTDSSSFTVAISNVAPVVDAGEGLSAFAGDSVDIRTSFADAGAGDTHTATINWGDGTVEPGTVTEPDGGAGTVDGSHVYGAAGTFDVTITVNDDDLGSEIRTV